MSTQPDPWEPPFAGSEPEQILGALDRLRATFRWKVDGLDASGLRAGIGSSELTLAGLLKHLALIEDYKFTVKMRGVPIGEPWASMDGFDETNDWEFWSAVEDKPEHLYALYDGAVARSRERVAKALAEGGLNQHIALTGPNDEPVTLRRLLMDFIEEYGRHTGHADLLREAVDGRVGEDPPSDWRPVSGSYAFA